MTPREYFEQIFEIDKEINSKQGERDDVRAKVIGATAWEHSPTFSNQFNSTSENIVLKLIDFENDINEAIDRLIDLKVKVSSEIDQLEDRRYRNLLRDRYIRTKDWECIAEEQEYDVRSVYRLHSEALEQFRLTYPDKFKNVIECQ